jgi:hypothetical protein
MSFTHLLAGEINGHAGMVLSSLLKAVGNGTAHEEAPSRLSRATKLGQVMSLASRVVWRINF